MGIRIRTGKKDPMYEYPEENKPTRIYKCEKEGTPKIKIEGDLAHNLAELFEWPHKEPVFIFTKEPQGCYGGYDSGLDYDKDGYTFEWEWQISKTAKK